MTDCLGGLREVVRIIKSEPYPETEPNELLVCVTRGRSITVFLCLIFNIRTIKLFFLHSIITVNREVMKRYSSLYNTELSK